MVSDRTQALETANLELSSTSQRLQLALDASRIAMWEWNIETNIAFQANLRELLGYNRSEEHTSELQSLMRISYAAFCLKQKNIYNNLINLRRTHIYTTY